GAAPQVPRRPGIGVRRLVRRLAVAGVSPLVDRGYASRRALPGAGRAGGLRRIRYARADRRPRAARAERAKARARRPRACVAARRAGSPDATDRRIRRATHTDTTRRGIAMKSMATAG